MRKQLLLLVLLAVFCFVFHQPISSSYHERGLCRFCFAIIQQLWSSIHRARWTVGDRAFWVAAASVQNWLPIVLKLASLNASFKRHVKIFTTSWNYGLWLSCSIKSWNKHITNFSNRYWIKTKSEMTDCQNLSCIGRWQPRKNWIDAVRQDLERNEPRWMAAQEHRVDREDWCQCVSSTWAEPMGKWNAPLFLL